MTHINPKGFQCLNCGKIHYPKHGRCLICKHTQFQEVNLPNFGRLVTFTSLRAPPSGIDESKIWLGIIQITFQNQLIRFTGQIRPREGELTPDQELIPKLEKIRTIDQKPIYGYVWFPK